MTTQISSIVQKKFKIKLVSGLHIGGTQEGLKIGGIDSAVIKNPLTEKPYIPGSSIKGKMRAMLEMVDYADLLEDNNYKVTAEGPIAEIFGAANNKVALPSKLIFSDFNLTEEWNEKFDKLGSSEFYEDKVENNVPRFGKGTATPRHIERVPSGVEFEGTITIIEYTDGNQDIDTILKKGVDLLNQTYLGGGGSRGNGRINMTEI